MALPSAVCKRDCMVRLHASPRSGISDVVERTLRGSPAQMPICLIQGNVTIMDVHSPAGVVWDGAWIQRSEMQR
jgi:hypothetical protein